MLKKIGNMSFHSTAIERFDVPSSVEEIGCFLFLNCTKLRSFNFAEDSKLKKIDSQSFDCTLDPISIPYRVEETGNFIFNRNQSQ